MTEDKPALTLNEARLKLHTFLKKSAKNLKKAVEIDDDFTVFMTLSDFVSKVVPYVHVSAQLAGIELPKEGEENADNGESRRDNVQPDI